jgi:crotonobetainyl-CoA:carnitine CoA-transferase CaiB-like acyl-CoA transferase
VNAKAASPAKVLAGIRVLDFGRFIAAPLCSAILADMGADVIRVEKREGGEDRWVQPVAARGEGATFLQCNRNKRSLTLDTTSERGQELMHKLMRGADVVLANISDAAMATNGLDYASLKAVKPDIILGRDFVPAG